MLALRLFIGALALGLAIGAYQCAVDAQTASDAVRGVLSDVFVIACVASLAFACIAVCCDHRTASQRRAAKRKRDAIERAKRRIDRAAYRYR
jgi:hypothetical protein